MIGRKMNKQSASNYLPRGNMALLNELLMMSVFSEDSSHLLGKCLAFVSRFLYSDL